MVGSSVLNAFLGEQHVADLRLFEDKIEWQYQKSWQEIGFPVSPHLPFSTEIKPINVNRFLRNMLPEGEAFDELVNSYQISRNNTFALVQVMGFDLPGALLLQTAGINLPQQPKLRPLSCRELTERLDKRELNGLILWDGKPRLSLAGIQDKLNIVIDHSGNKGFGEQALCSTYLLKFERQTQHNLVVNEFISMQLAKHCGLSVAETQLQQFGRHKALLVKRFDRELLSNGLVKRKHVIDGCQALNLPPEYKYERNFGSNRDVAHIRDGASLEKLFQFAEQCKNPAQTKQQLIDWVLFNIIIYNVDAHGKNVSFFVNPNGITLAPFYDLVNIKLFPQFEHELAMALGDEFDCDNIHAYQLADFADSCHLPRSYVATRLEHMLQTMLSVLDKPMFATQEEISTNEFFDQYKKIVYQRCMSLIDQPQEIISIKL